MPSSWFPRMDTWDPERLSAGAICSPHRLNTSHCALGQEAYSSGPHRWMVAGHTGLILGTLPSEADLGVSEETGEDFCAKRRASGL